MESIVTMKRTFGLIGYPLTHSFSKKYFTQKFQQSGCSDYEYLNFELDNIDNFPELFDKYPFLTGLNITIPYKRKILKFTDEVSKVVQQIGAANTLTLTAEKKISADNTDVTGFEMSIRPYLQTHHKRALIFGYRSWPIREKYGLKNWQLEYGGISGKKTRYRSIFTI